jgi:hypothetical protein
MTRHMLLVKKAFVLLLPVLGAALVYAVIADPALSYYRDLEAQLDAKRLDAKRNLTDRYRRLIAQREAFKGEPQKLERAQGLQELFYAAADANAAAALLQQRLSGIVTANGGQIRLARVETRSKAEGLDRFSVALTFAVSTIGLSKILYAVEGQRPALLVDSLIIRGGPALARLQNASVASAPGAVAAEEPVLEVSVTISGFLAPKG